ncbi:ABC transporter permease subunit [Amycolatopsis saalfeldensis]|uniref:Amino acid/amide ABC transporter membrane protein 2, HAAT family /amino acid/amide ABC transporter ATP-binding protein 1, HAAT family n=1 Tax=Amycolatopsis saalfeldensis TaxID=394193 RepID=A0A1H8XEZ8_9PSEU|nr:branched-chain amino acid ABC transporter ATP-binding protein/permease [Amycolatopsis saalfeldensis]SEP37828.1 amino acid/amide ABC transporter membrane protein 2, HAAT family /amino acid/amide ABC transporter ATP-binding protein 1, HAAT family [Amycolatopsis saalfeldensis]
MTAKPAWIRHAWIPVALAALLCFPLVSGDIYYQNLLIMTFLLAIGASGWNIMGGYAGYLSLGNSAFIGLGAYTTGILAAKADISPFAGCLVGGLVCAVGAALLSLVTRRTRGMYFVIVTFATMQLLGVVATTWSGLTGGSQGLALPLPAWSLSFQDWPFYYPMLGLLVVTVAVSAWVRRSKLGLGLFAIRDDEDKAAGLGLRTAVYKAIAFVLGGTFLGIAGGIYAYYVTFLNTAAVFDIITSVLIVLAVLLGGRGTLWGPVLGAFIVAPISNFTSTGLGGADAGAIRLLLFGGLLGAVAIFLPRGVLPVIESWFRRLFGRGAGHAPPIVSRSPVGGRAADRGAETSEVLVVRGLRKSFGGLRAVDGVDLDLAGARITGLIGPNGSGKTTLFNVIDGTVPSRDGTITVGGRRLERTGRPGRAHAGLARTYQLPRLFAGLTVVENLVVPERRFAFGRLWTKRVTAAERERALAVLDDLGLAAHADDSPAGLSYGQRKLVELAQVLWLDPVLVMLDEPAAGISPALSARLADLVRSLRRRGVGVLLVEHDLAFLSGLCEQVYVMSRGAIIAHGSVAEVSAEQAVVDAYLGDSPVPAAAEGHA